MLSRSLPVFYATLAFAGSSHLTRDGAYWVETVSATYKVVPSARLKLHVRGPITFRGSSTTDVTCILRKRVRAGSEAEARRLLDSVTLQSKPSRDWTLLYMENVARPIVGTELEITGPADLSQAIFETHSGDVQIFDVQGSVHVDSGGGMILLDRIGRDAVARTAGGEIKLGRVSGSVRCLSAGGSIQAERIGGESHLETAGGEIYVQHCSGPVSASTMGGNIQIGTAESTVWARTAAGRIEVKRAGGLVTAGNSGGSIQVGAANGVRCESSGGAIRLKGTAGALRAVTDVGSILAELISGTALQDSLLSTGSGDITIFIPSKLALTIMAQNDTGRTARIVSEFPEISVRLANEMGRSAALAEGTLNGGGPLLKISAASGTIYLRRQQ